MELVTNIILNPAYADHDRTLLTNEGPNDRQSLLKSSHHHHHATATRPVCLWILFPFLFLTFHLIIKFSPPHDTHTFNFSGYKDLLIYWQYSSMNSPWAMWTALCCNTISLAFCIKWRFVFLILFQALSSLFFYLFSFCFSFAKCRHFFIIIITAFDVCIVWLTPITGFSSAFRQ